MFLKSSEADKKHECLAVRGDAVDSHERNSQATSEQGAMGDMGEREGRRLVSVFARGGKHEWPIAYLVS